MAVARCGNRAVTGLLNRVHGVRLELPATRRGPHLLVLTTGRSTAPVTNSRECHPVETASSAEDSVTNISTTTTWFWTRCEPSQASQGGHIAKPWDVVLQAILTRKKTALDTVCYQGMIPSLVRGRRGAMRLFLTGPWQYTTCTYGCI